MDRRVAVSLEVAGLSVSFEGDAALFEREVRPLMEGVAAGGWRTRGAIVQPPPGPAEERQPPARGRAARRKLGDRRLEILGGVLGPRAG